MGDATQGLLASPMGGGPNPEEMEEEEDEMLAKVVSEDIEGCIHRHEAAAEDCADLRGWYAECQDTVRQILRALQELQEAADAATQETDSPEPFQKDVSVTSIISEEEVNESGRSQYRYLALGEDFDGDRDLQDVFVDCDLVAERVVDRKKIDGVAMYKVQWKGLGQPFATWIPADELDAPNLILKFEASRQPHLAKLFMAPAKSKGSRRTKHSTCGASFTTGESRAPAHDPLAAMVPVADGGPPEDYKPLNRRTARLFHGTRTPVAHAIIQDGFKLPEQRSGHGLGPIRPHMFGKGIYFTSSLEKAGHFGDTILVCEVLVGSQRVVDQADYGVTAAKLRKQGFDSVFAPPGCGGNVFDEYVVYHPGQIRVVGYLRR